MKILIHRFVLSILLLGNSLAYCQQFAAVENLEISTGLASEYVSKLVSSPSGFLYFATNTEIFKYDGYRKISVIKTKAIWSPLHLKDSFIYFHDASGLFQLNSNTDRVSCILKNNFNDSDPNNDHFNNIFVDSKGRIWGTDFNYVKFYAPKQKKLKSFLMNADNKTIDNYSIFQPSDSEVWIASKNGLYVWDESSNKIQLHQNKELHNLNFISAYCLNKTKVLLGTDAGEIWEINLHTNKFKKLEKLPNKESALGFFSFRNQVFVYTSRRIFSIENKGYSEIYFSENKIINNATIDFNTQIIWISTDKGLLKLPSINLGIQILKFPEKDTNENSVISLLSTSSKNLWALTDAGNVWNLKDKTWFPVFKNEESKSYCLNEVENKIILATDNGLLFWTGNTFEQIRLKELDSKSEIIKVLKISSKEIWIVYAHRKIQRYSWPDFIPLPDNFTNEEQFWKDNQWNDIVIDKEHNIWLVGWMPKGFGINRYDRIRHCFKDISDKNINKKDSVFVGDYYNRIGFDHHSNLLFSAYGGFNKVDENGKVLKKVDLHDYAISDPHIEGISEDEDGNVFFATGDGFHIYRQDVDKVVRISITDGMPTNNLLHAFFVLPDGKIALGVTDGIVIINPKKILKSPLQNKLNISQIKVNGLFENNANSHIELSKDQTDMTIYFSNLSFLDPGKVFYQYRFDDDEKWQDLGSTPELSLNHIAPGNYSIHIRTLDNLFNIQEKTLELSIIAHPPFFKSNLFYLLLLLCIILLVVLIQKYLSKRKQKEAAYRQKIKEIEMQMLRSQMNPHFMFNTLNSINSYIIQNKTEDASAYLTTFSKLMRSILQNSKEQFITLQNELQTLRLYIDLESARLDHSFSYTVNIDDEIFEKDIFVPPLIIQPFVENAIWHGLRNKIGNGYLSISVDVNMVHELKISIQDNGVGREKSAQFKSNQVAHKSFGMDITLERLKMLNEENTIEIEDLYDDKKQALGTKVMITLKFLDND